MDVVQVEGTPREEDYDAEDWTTIIGTYRGKSQSKARKQDLPEASEKTESTGGTHRNAHRVGEASYVPPEPAELRATASDAQKSANGSTAAACHQAKIPVDTEVEIRVHPTNNTCTVATTNQETALNVVKIRSITLNAKAYVIAAYIAPAAETGPVPVESSTMGEGTCARHTKRDQKLHKLPSPWTQIDVCRTEEETEMSKVGEDHGEDRSRHCVPRCILCGGEHLTGPGGGTYRETAAARRGLPKMASISPTEDPEEPQGQNESPVNQTPETRSWPAFERR
ncbi:hypothetical protein HPB52_024225 [Rhipicephalus sanguineus]|uniref:Uncharacterized protein n=1 Tax=Rhipicephalus sanguineus TaxID=34632 RepID=A0A9D4YR91_RHISA|nr:hypothetical protein HPB52_024225 [Rhipicephalus sanguineus]